MPRRTEVIEGKHSDAHVVKVNGREYVRVTLLAVLELSSSGVLSLEELHAVIKA